MKIVRMAAILPILVCALIVWISPLLRGDDATTRSELLSGEKFADQYFRPPPITHKGVTVLSEVIGSAPEMRTGSALFKAGAWYQLYVQSTFIKSNLSSYGTLLLSK